MSRQFVLVEDNNGEGIWCHGIYDDFHAALGYAMTEIYDFGDNYEKEGDFFEVSKPQQTEGDGGYVITVKYKAACWTHMDKPKETYYYILFAERQSDED